MHAPNSLECHKNSKHLRWLPSKIFEASSCHCYPQNNQSTLCLNTTFLVSLIVIFVYDEAYNKQGNDCNLFVITKLHVICMKRVINTVTVKSESSQLSLNANHIKFNLCLVNNYHV